MVNKMTLPQTIGKRIRLLRKSLGLTQQEFGKKIYRDKSMISKIESDEAELSSSNRLAICKIFGIREDWILKGEGEMKDLRDADAFLEETMELLSLGSVRKPYYGRSKVTRDYRGKDLVSGYSQAGFHVADALSMCERILRSETPHAITLYLTIKNFDLAISAAEKKSAVDPGTKKKPS